MQLSVVIPTWNRYRVLARTLEALLHQEEAPAFEVLVVDDGSTDATADVVTQIQLQSPVPVHYLYQPNRKQGAARNLGARRACGHWLVFLGDDIIPSPRFLAEHLAAHLSLDPDPAASRTSVIGYTTWPPEFRRTRFLDYIGEYGWQFGFALIQDPLDVPFNFFYTSNLSLPRRRFLESGGFDESFQEYGWEDIELSLRLQKAGMRLTYAEKASACHNHPLDLRRFAARQRQVGRSAWSFYRRHPDAAGFLGLDRLASYSPLAHLKMRVVGALCRLTEYRQWPDLSRFYPDLMTYYYMLGVLEGKDAGPRP